MFLIHIQVTKGVEIMYNFCCFHVDPVLNSPEPKDLPYDYCCVMYAPRSQLSVYVQPHST